jgi:hypothetical protein
MFLDKIIDNTVEISELAELKDRYQEILLPLLLTSSVTLSKEGEPFAQVSWGLLDDLVDSIKAEQGVQDQNG